MGAEVAPKTAERRIWVGIGVAPVLLARKNDYGFVRMREDLNIM